ncbi:hypothetical protein JD844_023912 [Phrynosoma platyrhinos]|uniref:DDE Tnp4 domain-containing protein n=1 Tax=Phrynosoma platyrhinos TaxID=52577 RepID=A0ABQ7SXM3_PHRPL|nr:hypothetical protein JD844_023912 [Phrynosoma platyrhinos]
MSLQVMAGFEEMGFLQVIGIVDGCHCEIIAPMHQGGQFINRKNRYSMLLQGTCNHTGHFIDIPGGGGSESNHDSFVFRNSGICEALRASVYVPENPTVTIFGRQVGSLLVADAAYPIRTWVMTLFKGVLCPHQAVFNKRLKKVKNVIEGAFGHLKLWWRCLTAPLEVAEENVNPVIAACVILHNILESGGKVLTCRPPQSAIYTVDPADPVLLSADQEKLGIMAAWQVPFRIEYWRTRETTLMLDSIAQQHGTARRLMRYSYRGNINFYQVASRHMGQHGFARLAVQTKGVAGPAPVPPPAPNPDAPPPDFWNLVLERLECLEQQMSALEEAHHQGH